MNIAILVTTALLALAGAPAAGADIKATYTCADGMKLVATFRNPSGGPNAIGLYFPKTGRQLVLPQVLSADGGRYAAGKTQFWVKGNQANFTRSNRNVTCQTKG